MHIEIVNYAHEEGYTVAGFVEEIYEDAHVLIGPLFGSDLLNPEKIMRGRVLSINSKYFSDESDHYVLHFVLELPDGKQAPLSYGKGYPVFFMLPEKVEALV